MPLIRVAPFAPEFVDGCSQMKPKFFEKCSMSGAVF